MAGNKQKTPYFRTAFRGPIGTQSGGQWQDGWSRRAYVDIGPYRVRNLLANDQIASAMTEAESDPRAIVRVGHYLIWRWALSVTSDGHTERHGFFSFWLHMTVMTVLFCIANTILFLLLGKVGWLGVALWGAHMYLNFTARHGSSVPRDVTESPDAG